MNTKQFNEFWKVLMDNWDELQQFEAIIKPRVMQDKKFIYELEEWAKRNYGAHKTSDGIPGQNNLSGNTDK